MVALVQRNPLENKPQVFVSIDASKGVNLYSNGLLIGNFRGKIHFIRFEEMRELVFDSTDDTMRIAKKDGSSSDWVTVKLQDFLKAVDAFDKFGEPQRMSASSAE